MGGGGGVVLRGGVGGGGGGGVVLRGGVGEGGGVVLRGGVGEGGGVVLRGGEEGRVRLRRQLEWRNKSRVQNNSRPSANFRTINKIDRAKCYLVGLTVRTSLSP